MRAHACLALVAAVLTGCDDATPSVSTCRDIPAGGCPLAHGVACDDPACAAAYACRDGAWVIDHVCASRDASADARPVVDAGPADATIDVPGANGGPGCGPLQSPDCPLATALSCGASCCGCEDLYVCLDAGWELWGSCADGGAVPK